MVVEIPAKPRLVWGCWAGLASPSHGALGTFLQVRHAEAPHSSCFYNTEKERKKKVRASASSPVINVQPKQTHDGLSNHSC